jgi:hypothetical protein
MPLSERIALDELMLMPLRGFLQIEGFVNNKIEHYIYDQGLVFEESPIT